MLKQKNMIYSKNILLHVQRSIRAITLGCCVLLAATSCRKYVEIDQKGTRTLKYTEDYGKLMDNTSVFEYSYGFPLISGDDAGIENVTQQNALITQQALTYQWAATRYQDTETDLDWDRLYKQIYVCNEVTDGVMDSERGTDVQKRKILANAKVHRAYAYLTLVNLYAKTYNVTTAATDLGVPLLLTSALFQDLTRASVAAVYDQIMKDLNEALSDLPDLPEFNSDPSKVGVYALMARTYQFQRKFEEAGIYADKVLTLQDTLLDLNNFATPASLPIRRSNPEIIFSKIVGGTYNVTLNNELLNLLGTTDQRYKLYTATNVYGRVYTASYGVYVGPGVPEMMLIKAESAARNNQPAVAVALLNKLSKKRMSAANYADLSANTGGEALTLAVAERRRELFGRGFRWFDMRRYDLDDQLAHTYTRTFKGETLTLERNSNRFTYAIAQSYIILNPEIIPNP